jgi:hypothetical protein
MFDGDGQRSATNNAPAEPWITPATVSQLAPLWKVNVSSTDGVPVYLKGVTTAQGVKNLVFVTATNGTLLALDSDNGSTVWQKTTSGPSSYTTSSPAIDPSGQFVYSYGLDGKVHKYAVTNGSEVATGGFPLTATILPGSEKGSSSLNIGGGYLYVTNGGYPGDAPPYDGHVTCCNLATGASNVFNSLMSNNHAHINNTGNGSEQQSGIWARAGSVLDPVMGYLLVTTGNGPFGAGSNGWDYADSVIAVSPDLSQIVDSYTPSNYIQLNNNDQDLGSCDPVLLPVQSGSSTPYLAVMGGKDNTLRLLNRQNLSGKGGPNHIGGELQSVSIGDVVRSSQPVAMNDSGGQTWVFVFDDSENLYAYQVVTSGGQSQLALAYSGGSGCHTSPLVVNGMLFAEGSAGIRAFQATSGAVLWTGSLGGDNVHWTGPCVANGRVYAPDSSGAIRCFALPNTKGPQDGLP